MTDLTSLTLAQARDGLRKKEITAAELTDAHVGAVEAARALNAFVRETPDHARAMARASDARLAKGEGGPLEGIPLGIKDLFCTKGRAHDGLLAHPRRIHARPTSRPSPPICGATARSCSASSTMTSSRWARRTRPRASARW
jgi:hypothetical protein